MSAVAALAALAPVAAAFLLLHATLRDADGTRPPLLLLAALALGIGPGIASALYFVLLLIVDGARAAVVAADLLFLLAAAGVWRWRTRSTGVGVPAQRTWSRLEIWLLAGLAGVTGIAIVIFAASALISPHGGYDALTTWNLRARAIFRAGSDWRIAFMRPNGLIGYPPLVATTVARGWTYLGADPVAVPIAVAALFTAATVLLLIAAVSDLRGRAQALIAGICLAGTPLLATRAASQYADIPLAYFLLACLTLLARWDVGRGGAAELLWAGLAAGLAAWTKDEGVAFAGALAAARLGIALYRRRIAARPLGWFVAGAAPAVALLLVFKIRLGGASHRFKRQGGDMVAQLIDPARIATLLGEVVRQLVHAVSLAPLLAVAAYVALMGRCADPTPRRAGRHVALVLVLAAVAYAGVLLVTPQDLVATMRRSLDRLLLQLWPSALLAAFLWSASPDDEEFHHKDTTTRRGRGKAVAGPTTASVFFVSL